MENDGAMAQSHPTCHVLLLYKELIPSVRLCGHCQMEVLARQGKVEYRARQEMAVRKEDLHWADVVLLGRLDDPYERELSQQLYDAGKYLIYIIDDDLLNIPEGISSRDYYIREDIQDNIRGMMRLSRAILSPSPHLHEKYAVDGQLAIPVEEPSLYPISYAPHDPELPVKIGFAGSIDRVQDIERILSGALKRIKSDYGDRVQVEFFGAIPSFAADIGARTIPYCQSYDDYRATLNSLEWDIGLAPMPDTPFHACKHYNKFVEYAASGIVGVYSRVDPYLRAMEKFGLGRFCENDEESWYGEIKRLVDDRRSRERLREAVCVCASTETDQETSALQLYESMKEALAYRAPQKRFRYRLQSGRVRGLLSRLISAVRTHKLRLPLVVIQKIYRKCAGKLRKTRGQ